MIASYAVGDSVAEFCLRSTGGSPLRLSDHLGVPVVLLFLGEEAERAVAALRSFAPAIEGFSTLRTPVFAISTTGTCATTAASACPPPLELLLDPEGELSGRFGAAARLRAVLLNFNTCVARIYDPDDPTILAAQVLSDVIHMVAHEPPRLIHQQAPVLLHPDVFPSEFCRLLIDGWHDQGNQDSGFVVQEGAVAVGKHDYSHKVRRDHFVRNGSEIYLQIKELLARRLVRQVKKAMGFEATRLEDMKIACYDAARGGYFRPHRDNTTSATAHRRFAVSVLLNEDYEGGCLRFPEYGPHLYRPKAGGAIVFSCSLLHEVTDVTAGRRFVLLTFFYGEQDAKLRQQHSHPLSEHPEPAKAPAQPLGV